MTSSLCEEFLQTVLFCLFVTRDSFHTYIKLAKALNPLIAIQCYQHEVFTGGKYDHTPPESILSTNKNQFGNLAAVSPSLPSIKAS